MGFSDVLAWLHGTGFASTIRENTLLFPWIESVHVLAVTIVVGSIAIVDLRLLGLASTTRSVNAVSAEVLPLTWTAFLFAVITGAALFSSHSIGYGHNFQFRMKMLLLLLAGLNMMTFQFIIWRGIGRWDDSGAAPWQGRIAGGISLVLWISIVAFGRWIGFTGVV